MGVLNTRIDNEKMALAKAGAASVGGVDSKMRKRLLDVIMGKSPSVDLQQLLTDILYRKLLLTMVAGYAAGYRRVYLEGNRAKPSLKLSAIDDAVAFLNNRSDLDLTELEKKFGPYAFRAVQDATPEINAKLMAGVRELITNNAHLAEAKDVLGDLFDKVGLTPANPYTIENLYRTQLSIAYNAGKWNAEQSPEIQEILWGYEYNTVDDDRVRPEHAALEGVKLPKDDPFWSRFYPPNGFSCRCNAIPLFDPPEGGEKEPPKEDDDGNPVQPDKGFDVNFGQAFKAAPMKPEEERQNIITPARPRATPPASAPAPAPDPTPLAVLTPTRTQFTDVTKKRLDTKSMILEMFEDPTQRELAIEISKNPSEKFHLLAPFERSHPVTAERVQDYRARTRERAQELSESRKQFLAGEEKLNELYTKLGGIKSQMMDLVAKGESSSGLYADHDKAMAEIKAAKLEMNKTLRVNGAAEIRVDTNIDKGLNKAQFKDRTNEAIEFFQGRLASNVLEGMPNDLKTRSGGFYTQVDWVKKNDRSYYSSTDNISKMSPFAGADVVVHEIAHSLEQNPQVFELAKGFLYSRIQNEQYKPLGEVFTGTNYKESEIGAKDQLDKGLGTEKAGYYAGKFYPSNTEVISMGVEQMFRDPINFAKNDPEYFDFINGVLNGSLLQK